MTLSKASLLLVVGIASLVTLALGATLWLPREVEANPEAAAIVPSSEVEGLSQGAGEEQQVALEDKRVTDTEYSDAVYATVKCIRDAGIPVSDPSWSGGRLEYTGGPFATHEELKAAKPTMQACYELHLRSIDVVQAR